MLTNLHKEFFYKQLEIDTKHKSECPVYFMPCDTLTATGENGNDLVLSDSYEGKDVKTANEKIETYRKLGRITKVGKTKITEA